MVTRFGMDETIGQRSYSQAPPSLLDPQAKERINAAEATVREIDLAVRQLIEAGFERASDILQSRRQDLDAGANRLLEHETITADEFPPIKPRLAMPAGEPVAKPSREAKGGRSAALRG